MVSLLCCTFKLSRQAYYQQSEIRLRTRFQITMVVELVCEVRVRMPRIGGRKLYFLLQNDFELLDYKLGRDKFFSLLREERLLVRPKKRAYKTTDSAHEHLVYPNLLKGLMLCRPFQAICVDITYIRLKEGFCFLSLATDIFSRCIIGWHLSTTLEASGPIYALKEARLCMGWNAKGCIHHSDQGVQYCCYSYVSLLFRFKMLISMSDTGSPGQNAVAERVNGILKGELLLDGVFNRFPDARSATEEAILIYNHERPHNSLGLLTPERFLKENRITKYR